uniref:Uncharacterized protein n=1 Tax=Anguilla anguilla TaxID=7936 RepID=A0A0E9RA91_ANGAN
MWLKRVNNPFKHENYQIKNEQLVQILGLQLQLEQKLAYTGGPQDQFWEPVV